MAKPVIGKLYKVDKPIFHARPNPTAPMLRSTIGEIEDTLDRHHIIPKDTIVIILDYACENSIANFLGLADKAHHVDFLAKSTIFRVTIGGSWEVFFRRINNEIKSNI